jgi:hypothetical protein
MLVTSSMESSTDLYALDLRLDPVSDFFVQCKDLDRMCSAMTSSFLLDRRSVSVSTVISDLDL